jgi:hypothetical protein
MLNIRYKDKMHLFAMNGQTGKMIGDIPISMSRLIWKSVSIWAACSMLTFLILLVAVLLA